MFLLVITIICLKAYWLINVLFAFKVVVHLNFTMHAQRVGGFIEAGVWIKLESSPAPFDFTSVTADVDWLHYSLSSSFPY